MRKASTRSRGGRLLPGLSPIQAAQQAINKANKSLDKFDHWINYGHTVRIPLRKAAKITRITLSAFRRFQQKIADEVVVAGLFAEFLDSPAGSVWRARMTDRALRNWVIPPPKRNLIFDIWMAKERKRENG